MKIKPNTLFKKWGRVSQTDLGNPEDHNFGLVGPALWKSQESRVKSQGGDAWDKTTDVRSASILGLDTRKALLGVPRERSGTEQSWVGSHTGRILGMAAWHAKARPTGISAPMGWHLPLQAIPFCSERCRGAISEGSELTLTSPRGGRAMAKTGWGLPVPSCRGMGLDYFQIPWLQTSTFLDGVSVSSQTICFLVGAHSKCPTQGSKHWLPTAWLHEEWKYTISTRFSVRHWLCV